MPAYDKKAPFEVYNVIGVKDAMALIKRLTSNTSTNTQDAEDFFIEKGVTVYGLVAPAHRLSDKINEVPVPTTARDMAAKDKGAGRS